MLRKVAFGDGGRDEICKGKSHDAGGRRTGARRRNPKKEEKNKVYDKIMNASGFEVMRAKRARVGDLILRGMD